MILSASLDSLVTYNIPFSFTNNKIREEENEEGERRNRQRGTADLRLRTLGTAPPKKREDRQ